MTSDSVVTTDQCAVDDGGRVPADVITVGPISGLHYVTPTTAMAEELAALELAAFPTTDRADLYDAAALTVLATEFPQGGVVGFDGPGREHPVAAGLGVRTHFDFDHPNHHLATFFDGAPTECGDDPGGPWYYGTDIIVRPDHRRRGIGTELYDLRKDICRRLNLAGIVAGGVIPGFADHKHQMSADEYVTEVSTGRLYDRTLSFQLENGFVALCALDGYMADPAVDDHASLIVWYNPDHRPGGGGAT